VVKSVVGRRRIAPVIKRRRDVKPKQVLKRALMIAEVHSIFAEGARAEIQSSVLQRPEGSVDLFLAFVDEHKDLFE